MNHCIQSAGFVIFYETRNQKRLFLLLHYVDGHWDFPKGKVENGESLLQAAQRELHEETGLTIGTLLHDFNTTFDYMFIDRTGVEKRKEVTLFLASVDSMDVVLSDEHQGYAWLNTQEVREKLTYQNAQAAFEAACNYLAIKI